MLSSTITADVVLTLTLVTGACSSLAGRLNVISQNESIDLYDLTLTGGVSNVFSAQLELNLRSPCPFCHTSYNLMTFDEHVLVPGTGIMTIFTFVRESPYVYTQSVLMTDCEPLSIIRSSQSPNQLFLDCKDLANEGNYFVADLILSSDSTGHQRWTFQKLKTFARPGTFVEVSATGSVMMLYAHQNNNYIEVNGFLSGYINLLSLPDGCSRVVRITATAGAVLFLECSNDVSELVTSVHLLMLDSVTSTHLLDTAPYEVCPIRFTENGQFAAVFTQTYITVIDLVTHVFTSISVNQAIYDGVITQSDDDSVYLVYTTASGLNRVSLTLEGGDIKVPNQLLFSDSGTACADLNCPLLTLIDSDTVVATLDQYITIFSISELSKVGPNVRTKYQPSRIVFQEKIISPLPQSSSLSQTQKTTTLMYRPKETATPPKFNDGIQKQQGKHSIIIVTVLVPLITVALGVACVIYMYLRVRKHHLMIKSRLVKARYVCNSSSSDAVHLIHNDSLSFNHNESGVEPTTETSVTVNNDDDEIPDQEPTREDKEEEGVQRQCQRETQTHNEHHHLPTLLQPQHSSEEKEGHIHEGEEAEKEEQVAVKPKATQHSPTAESVSDHWTSSMPVYAQETNSSVRFGEHQQQVVGSVEKETQEVRESPDGCTSS